MILTPFWNTKLCHLRPFEIPNFVFYALLLYNTLPLTSFLKFKIWILTPFWNTKLCHLCPFVIQYSATYVLFEISSPIKVYEPMKINPDQSKKKFSISYVENCSKINPTHSVWIRDFNPNNTEQIRSRIHSDRFGLNTWFRSIRVRIDSDSFGLKILFGLNRNESDWFPNNFQKTRLTNFREMIRIGSDTNSGMIQNSLN